MRFPTTSTSGERRLQEDLGTRERAESFYRRQVLDHLNEAMRHFIGRQEMMFVATSDAQGECDSTLRAGPPGFVAVLDHQRLAWPEYRGNGVMASRGNILENPHVGLLFVDFVHDTIGLHVNGSAKLVADDDLRHAHPELPVDTVPGRRPEQWVVAHVKEAYIHCSKHIPRLHHHPGDRRANHSGGKKSDYFVGPAGITPDAMAGSPADILAGSPADAMIGSPADILAGSPADAMIGSPADILTGCPADAMAGSPADILTGCPANASPGNPADVLNGSQANASAGSQAAVAAGSVANATAGTANGSPAAGFAHNGEPASRSWWQRLSRKA